MKCKIEQSKNNKRWYVRFYSRNGKQVASLDGGNQCGFSTKSNAKRALYYFADSFDVLNIAIALNK